MKSKLFLMTAFLFCGFVFLRCTHDDELTNTAPVITHGTNVFLPGNLTAGNANEWKGDIKEKFSANRPRYSKNNIKLMKEASSLMDFIKPRLSSY